MGTVCVVGSLNIDLVTRVSTHPNPGETVRGDGLARLPGGKGANQALAAARADIVAALRIAMALAAATSGQRTASQAGCQRERRETHIS